MELEWTVISVFPNLMLEGLGATPDVTLPGSPYSIVSGNDARVQAFAEQVTDFQHLLNSFQDDQGESYLPAVLIEESKAAVQNRRWRQSITAFRNSIAFSYILINRASTVGRLNALSPLWSDTFDLFPIHISQGYIHKITPALYSVAHPMESHLATPSPHLQLQRRLNILPDTYLIRTLGDAWLQHYKRKKRRDHYFIALFRSLEIAYQAASIAAKNQASEYDYGIGIGLWVNAIEVLAHQGPGGSVSVPKVLDLLEQYAWHRPRFKRRSFKNPTKWKSDPKKRKRVNAVSAIYLHMYLARNDYLHGNPVSPGKLRPHLGSTRVNLPWAASTVYRVALAAHLEKRYPRLRPEETSLLNRDLVARIYIEGGVNELISASTA